MNEEKNLQDKINSINIMLDEMMKNIIQINNTLTLHLTELKYENENN